MSALIFQNSRYRYKALIQESPDVLRIPAFLGLKNTDYPDNITIRVKQSDRLDTLSFELYGSSRFDWVIAAFNNIKFPVSDLRALDTIIVPSADTLFNIILPELALELEGEV